MGDTTDRNVPTQAGMADDWAAVAGGHGRSLGLKTDGSLWAWGENDSGQLGLGDHTDRTLPRAWVWPTTGWPSPAVPTRVWP